MRTIRLLLLALTALAAACTSISPPPNYVQDAWGTVSWVTWDANLNNVIVLQRAPLPVTFWTPAGQLVNQWTTNQLGDPHSLTLQAQAGGQPWVWITDMAGPLLAGNVYGHCVKQFTFGGQMVSTIGTCGQNSQGTGLDPLQFDEVTDIAFFPPQNLIFITDGDLNGLNNRTLTLDASEQLIAVWSAPNNQPGSGPLQSAAGPFVRYARGIVYGPAASEQHDRDGPLDCRRSRDAGHLPRPARRQSAAAEVGAAVVLVL